MISLQFFARYREVLGDHIQTLPYQAQWRTVADLRAALIEQGGDWQVLSDSGLMCALNDEMCKLDSQLQAGDRVAFFPTVTGG